MSAVIKTPSNTYTLVFVLILCTVCGALLAALATGLKPLQEQAQDLDRSKQLLIAAHIYDAQGCFLTQQTPQNYVPAKMDATGQLQPTTTIVAATEQQVERFSQSCIVPMVVDQTGELKTFAQAGINFLPYINAHRKTGYAHLPQKLIYAVFPQGYQEAQPMSAETYILPVSGRGLWDAIYGYLAIANDGNRVIGTAWYKHAETPGLGANIAEADWQAQFLGKVIFQPDSNGQTDFTTAPLGLTVIKGKVKDILGNSPKAFSAVDGISGSTLTGNGVTEAYKQSIEPYRPFPNPIAQFEWSESTIMTQTNHPTARFLFIDQFWRSNQVVASILGICSALAVTNNVKVGLTMGVSVALVTAFSSLLVSLIRKYTPDSVRMITQLAVISLFVITVDQILRAYFYDVSKVLSVFVGLIITNCIVMGRAEAMAKNVPPIPAFMDGLGAGLGYAIVLFIISIFRELLGFGTLFNVRIIPLTWYADAVHPDGYQNFGLMALAPAAFFLLAGLIWITNLIKRKDG